MNLKIAVPSDENGILDGHFGHCKIFEVFETTDNKIISQIKLTPPPHEPGIIPKWLVQNGITDVITSGIGEKAAKILTHFKVNVHKGASKIESINLVENLLNQTLELSDKNCNHHHEHGHDHHHKNEYRHLH